LPLGLQQLFKKSIEVLLETKNWFHYLEIPKVRLRALAVETNAGLLGHGLPRYPIIA
jgi:hypothetical protein